MKKTWMWTIKLFLVIAIIVTAGVVLPQSNTAYAAAGAINVLSVEYYEEQIVVQNNGNTKICFATETDAARNNWEVINVDQEYDSVNKKYVDSKYTTIDMSWLSSSTENIILVKGYEDPTGKTSRVVLKAKPAKLDVSIGYSNLDALIASSPDSSIASLVNIMTSEGTGNVPINFTDLEWRKGETGQWKNTDELTASLVEKYLVKGTTLYFRIRAKDDVVNIAGKTVDFYQLRVNGQGGILSYLSANTADLSGTDYPDGTEGRRFSNEVKVKIGKKSVASGYGIDGSKFTANIKYGNEYRVTIDSDKSDWIKVTDRTVKSTLLSTIVKSLDSAAENDGTEEGNAFPAMKIEVRDYATSKAASSKITEINLNAQRTITNDIEDGPAPESADASDTNIYVSYNGNKNIILEIPSASSSLPYEYTVVKASGSLDMTKASWTAVTKGTEVKILASKAVDGGTLYVRMKEIKAKNATSTSNAVGFELASTYVSTVISYPSVPEIEDAAYVFTKGYSKDIIFTVILNESDETPFEKEIKTIKLGTKEVGISQVASTDTEGRGIITVTLKAESLETLANCYVKPLTITYTNGTIDRTSIKLTIQSSTSAGVLTVTHAKATNTAGCTAFSIITPKSGISNKWYYVVTDAAISGVNTQDLISDKTTVTPIAITSASVDDLLFTTGKYLTIFEVNSSDYIVKYKSIQITSDYIK